MADPIHIQKVRHLQSQGMEQCGVVMSQPDNDKPHAYDVAIVSGAAVRWMPRDEFWLLMHPSQGDAPEGLTDEAFLRTHVKTLKIAHDVRVSELLAANNAEVERRRAAERWAAFGRAVMKQHKDGDCGDVDGEWLQGTGVQTGVLQVVEAKGPCAEEGCMCAATCGDWPVDCYRVVTP